jgi:hypothetical protein
MAERMKCWDGICIEVMVITDELRASAPQLDYLVGGHLAQNWDHWQEN